MNPNILAIVGMHRSGTSLTAGWLQSCGLYVGEELIPPTVANPKGHFEDITISQFQRQILRDSGWDTHLITEAVIVDEYSPYQEKIESLISSRMDFSQWGWKDPRTSLLLQLWKHYVPNLKVVAVYRHYDNVIDSLIRRERKHANIYYTRQFRDKWKKLLYPIQYSYWNKNLIRTYLKSWITYNQSIVEFQQQAPNDILLFHVDRLNQHHQDIVHYINRTWGFELNESKFDDFYEAKLLKQNARAVTGLDETLISTANNVMGDLERLSSESLSLIRTEKTNDV